jgi:hypothetical protein
MARNATSPEVGALVHFEHVNLRVDDHRPAHLYFIEGLGLTRDPYRMVGVTNMWVNAGHQQFHLPIGKPTPLPGEVALAVHDLASVQRRLERIAPLLKGSAFSCRAERGTLATTTPWGHAVRVHSAARFPGNLPQSVPFVTFRVPPGTAEGIARFYRELLYCPADVAGGRGARRALVNVGPHQQLRFQETPGARVIDCTNHVAVYLARYHEVHDALHARKLVTEADAREQFRFQDIVHPESGKLLFRFEHEMRSLYHPEFHKPLVNRVPVPYPVD